MGELSPQHLLFSLQSCGDVNAVDDSGKIDRRRLSSLNDIGNIVKGLRKSNQFHTNDVAAVGNLLEQVERTQPGTVLKHTPQKRNE